MGAGLLKLVSVLAIAFMVGLSGLTSQASSHMGQDVFRGPKPSYEFISAEFVVRVSSNVFESYNSTLISFGRLDLEGRRLNSTHVEVKVVITGSLKYPKPGSNLTINNVYILEKGMGFVIPGVTGRTTPKETISSEDLRELSRITEALEFSPFNASYTFLVDTRYNYAYIDGEPIGFFPLYSFLDIKYEEAADYAFTYLGRPLELEMTDGAPTPHNVRYMGYGFVALSFENEFVEFLIVHNYMAVIDRLVLPIGGGVYIMFGIIKTPGEILEYVELIDDDYPTYVRVGSFWKKALVLGAVVVVLAVLARRMMAR